MSVAGAQMASAAAAVRGTGHETGNSVQDTLITLMPRLVSSSETCLGQPLPLQAFVAPAQGNGAQRSWRPLGTGAAALVINRATRATMLRVFSAQQLEQAASTGAPASSQSLLCDVEVYCEARVLPLTSRLLCLEAEDTVMGLLMASQADAETFLQQFEQYKPSAAVVFAEAGQPLPSHLRPAPVTAFSASAASAASAAAAPAASSGGGLFGWKKSPSANKSPAAGITPPSSSAQAPPAAAAAAPATGAQPKPARRRSKIAAFFGFGKDDASGNLLADSSVPLVVGGIVPGSFKHETHIGTDSGAAAGSGGGGGGGPSAATSAAATAAAMGASSAGEAAALNLKNLPPEYRKMLRSAGVSKKDLQRDPMLAAAVLAVLKDTPAVQQQIKKTAAAKRETLTGAQISSPLPLKAGTAVVPSAAAPHIAAPPVPAPVLEPLPPAAAAVTPAASAVRPPPPVPPRKQATVVPAAAPIAPARAAAPAVSAPLAPAAPPAVVAPLAPAPPREALTAQLASLVPPLVLQQQQFQPAVSVAAVQRPSPVAALPPALPPAARSPSPPPAPAPAPAPAAPWIAPAPPAAPAALPSAGAPRAPPVGIAMGGLLEGIRSFKKDQLAHIDEPDTAAAASSKAPAVSAGRSQSAAAAAPSTSGGAGGGGGGGGIAGMAAAAAAARAARAASAAAGAGGGAGGGAGTATPSTSRPPTPVPAAASDAGDSTGAAPAAAVMASGAGAGGDLMSRLKQVVAARRSVVDSSGSAAGGADSEESEWSD